MVPPPSQAPRMQSGGAMTHLPPSMAGRGGSASMSASGGRGSEERGGGSHIYAVGGAGARSSFSTTSTTSTSASMGAAMASRAGTGVGSAPNGSGGSSMSSSGMRSSVTSSSSAMPSPMMTSVTTTAMSTLDGNGGDLRFARPASNDGEGDDDKAPTPVAIVPWRTRERMKTMDVALVLCLNIGTDPPDVVKASPCARKECWVDPFSMPSQKALDTIGKTLQSQYERWQPRARYRQSLDPTVDEVKQISVSMRRHAKHDRVLYHYNGHGVPRPTPNGEIWVFNKSYTQYIPLLVYDLQGWIGTPSIYVFDCSAAGILLSHFNNPTATAPTTVDGPSSSRGHRNPMPSANVPAPTASGAMPTSSAGEAIVLAACAANEILPTNPELCADVFTSCLTTPITVALRWFITQNELSMAHLDASFIERIPGKLADRKTPLGELNWIFTAITDTIAWNVLPRSLFQKLFRQDLLVASLFRNFLLAERIMKANGCTPCSLPALPPTNHHPLWRSWDLAAEVCLNQLYRISNPHPHSEVSFQPSRFFAEQLTAFEVWLQFGAPTKSPPQQLPMVLQVLLSQVHRLRALVLLKKFLDLGPWAVNLALSVGIFPYVLKLLQSPASELRHVLVFIWAKVLALDPSCQLDLVKDDGHAYFISHLSSGIQVHSHGNGHGGSSGGASQYGSQYGFGGQHVGSASSSGSSSTLPPLQKVMAAFILSVICNQCPQGQKGCMQQYLHKICGHLLMDPHDDVREWSCLCLAKLWENFEEAKRIAIDDQLPRLLSRRLHDETRPEVRAAACYALGSLLGLQFDGSMYGPSTDPVYVDEFLKQRAHSDLKLAAELLWGCHDASPLVRRESVLALANVVLHTYHQPRFEAVARNVKNRSVSGGASSGALEQTTAPHGLSTPLMPTSLPGETIPGNTHRARDGQEINDERFPIGVGIHVDDELVEELGADAKYYTHIWYVLKDMQLRDSFPKVVSAVKVVVGRVNARVLAAEQEAASRAGVATSENEISPSNSTSARSVDPISAGVMHREGSVPNLPGHLQNHSNSIASDTASGSHSGDLRGMGGNATARATQIHNEHTAVGVGGMRPTQSVGNFRVQYQEEYRRGGSTGVNGVGGGNDIPSSIPAHRTRGDDQSQMASSAFATTTPGLPTHARCADFPVSLISTLYERRKARFNEPILEPVREDDDPLSDRGAEKLERIRRYEHIRRLARKFAPGFSAPHSDGGVTQNPYMMYYNGPQSSMGMSGANTAGMPPSYSYSSAYSSSGPRVGIHADREEVQNFKMNLRQRAVLNNDAEMTSLLLFHPYETMLIVADEKDQISVYNVDQSEKKLLTFGNKNPTGSRLTSLSWINESEESLLTCGSDDGVVRIYHGLHTSTPAPRPPKLVSSFLAVPDLVPGTKGSGLVTTWQQNAGMLFAGGNSGVLRGWNLHHERCTFTVPTQTDSCVTTLASDESTGGMVVAGFGDGSLRLFDPRSRPEYAHKCTMHEHTSWVVQTHLYAGKNELLSGSVSGELKFWDLRYPKSSVRALEAHRSPMTALAVHDYAPIFASGSHNQFIKVFRSDGEQLALIRYHEGFLGERIGPVSCLAFHPHRLFLAAGGTDSVIAIYSGDK